MCTNKYSDLYVEVGFPLLESHLVPVEDHESYNINRVLCNIGDEVAL